MVATYRAEHADAGQQRRRDRLAGHPQSPRPAARQPALPVDRHRALLPGPADHSRQDQRHRRLAVRRAGHPHRPQRGRGLEPHRLDRVPVHALPAQDGRAGHPTEYLENGHPVKMIARKVTVHGAPAGGKLAPVTRTLYSTRYGPMINDLLGHGPAVDQDLGLHHARRQRERTSPAPSRPGSASTGPSRPVRCWPRSRSSRASPGSTRSRPTGRARRCTRTSAIDPRRAELARAQVRHPARRPDVRRASGCRSWTARRPPATGSPARTRPRPG